MMIIQATRVLTEVHLSMFAKITSDHLGNPCPVYTMGLSSFDIDATGSLNTPDFTRAFSRLARQAERKIGSELGMGWHDLI